MCFSYRYLRRSTSVVIALAFQIFSPAASAQTSCAVTAGGALQPSQIKNLCELECRAEAGSETHSPLAPKPAECATAENEVKADLEEPMWKKMADCAVSAAYGSLTNIADLLAPADFRMFVATCSKDVECKRKLARDIDQYRARKPDGSYQIPDSEVDAKMTSANFVNEYFRSKHDVGSNMDVCQDQLGKITRSLNNALSDASTDSDKQKQLQARYDALSKFDADCPRLLHLKPPGDDHFQPDLNRVAKNTAAAASTARARLVEGAKADLLLKPVVDFFKDLKISYQCYDGATRRQLICYALGHAVDPTLIVGGGVGVAMGAKALIKSGMARYAKHEIISAQKQVVKDAFSAVDELRAKRSTMAQIGADTTEIDGELAARKKAAGDAMINYSFVRSAVLLDEAKFRSFINENSLIKIEQATQTKPMSISVKTIREGENAGLVVDPATNKPILIGDRPVTSDADVKKRMRKFKAGPVQWSDAHGFESTASAASRESENAGFHEIDRRSVKRDLVQHGPLEDLPASVDKFHKPLVIEDKYPITVYLPNGDIRIVRSKMEEDLVSRQLGQAGYR